MFRLSPVRRVGALALALLVVAAVTAGCTAQNPANSSPAAASLSDLQRQLAQRDQTIAQLQKDNTEMKRQLSTQASTPSSDSVAVGHGDGRFTVVPSRVRPGEPIAVFTDNGSGTINVFSKATDQKVLSFAGPSARHFAVQNLPRNLAPGEYLVTFSGPGGTSGEATITVEAGE